MSKKILIVDDEPDCREILKQLLNLQGYTTLTAGDGQACCEIVERNPVDLLVLDLMMSPKDGWDVLRWLRNQETLARVPVIILTAKNQSIDKVLALKVFGVQDYITKPFRRKELLERISRFLESGNQGDAEDAGCQL